MSRHGFAVHLPSNKSIIPSRDFAGSIFDPYFPPVSSSQAATIYFIRGDVTYFLLCNELSIGLVIAAVGALVFLGVGYTYFLNQRMHVMFNDNKARMSSMLGGGMELDRHQAVPNFNMSPAFGMLDYGSGNNKNH